MTPHHRTRTNNQETIFALATPMGRSGVAIIRISGPSALSALPRFGYTKTPEPRKAIYHHFTLPLQKGEIKNEILDSGLILFFPGPQSFTGEDSLEFQIHGSIAVIKTFLSQLSEIPKFRTAVAGEFARRAFENGKMDLTASEGLADLIEAETEWQRRHANYAAQGHIAKRYASLRKSIMTPLALLEAYIDFPDEDIPDAVYQEVGELIDTTKNEISQILKETLSAEKIKEGISVVILGEPNVGKSTLLNTLSRKDAAIVSSEAGTTRDIIEVNLDIGGYPITLIDTAGIRETENPIEQEGIKRAKEKARNADLKLLLIDASAINTPEVLSLKDDNSIVVRTKSDLGHATNAADHGDVLDITVKDEKTITNLLEKIREWVSEHYAFESQPLYIRERHRECLNNALTELSLYNEEKILELQCERLRLATIEIGKITGEVNVEELLDIIFSAFCIGK